MTDEMKKQIKDLAFKGYYRKIVDLILAVPEDERDSEMNLQLTYAYNESKQYPKAIKTLESIQKDCENQVAWHYQMGYALYYKEKYAQAEEFLSKAASIVTDADFDLKNNIGKLLDKARFQLDYIKRLGDKEEFLPENFPELMREGNLEKLKKVYEKCAIAAHLKKDDRWTTPFYYDTPCTEFYQWLVEQGLDINGVNQFGQSALTERAGRKDTNFEGLLKAGADTHVTIIWKAWNAAIRFDRVEYVRLLIEYGADVNAAMHEGSVKTPLDWVLRNLRVNRLVPCYKMAEMLIEKGAEYTLDAKKIIEDLGKDFEFRKSGTSNGNRTDYDAAMDRLYELFEVKPVKPIIRHDGASPIVVDKFLSAGEQYIALWDYLVPSSGKCATVQGEVIRITGRIGDEIYRNGGLNWDSDYRKMLKALQEYFGMGTSLDSADMEQVGKSAKAINQFELGKKDEGDVRVLQNMAVKWVSINTTPILLEKVSYKR